MKSQFLIGSRGSKLALYQAELVKAKLEQSFPLLKFDLVKIKTSGDMIRRAGPDPFTTKRVYTKEIEEALERNEIDFGIHSAKDLAVQLPSGLMIGAVLEREDPRDCLISRDGKKLSELPMGARIGTSAIRRRLQLLKMNPELVIEDVRGNVDTRIHKLEEGAVDAIVLAYAGVKRLGMIAHVTEVFPENQFFPAPCQGAIVVESRLNDAEAKELLHPLNHPQSAFRVACERAFLRRLEGGCQLPCGITTRFEEEDRKFVAAGIFFSLDGNKQAEASFDVGVGLKPTPTEAETIGIRLADEILAQGGNEILQRMHRDIER